jgi:outer membrane protein OmpA-like peptidoglycan-associated protein
MNPTIINWSKGKAPIAVVQNHPVSVSDKIDLKMPVTAVNPNDYSAYRWKIGATPDTNCKSERDYSSEIPGQMPIVTDIGPIPDGGITLCAVAKSNSGIWQPFSMPTVVQWEKKKGYELFRLSANVLFDFDKDELQQRSFGELEKVNLHLSRRPYARVVIEGHTDSFGTDQYNVDLSQRRAARVMNYMIEKYKWDAKKIKTMHMGEKFPVDTNETDEGRANNRRVEFKIFRK